MVKILLRRGLAPDDAGANEVSGKADCCAHFFGPKAGKRHIPPQDSTKTGWFSIGVGRSLGFKPLGVQGFPWVLQEDSPARLWRVGAQPKVRPAAGAAVILV